MEKDTGKIKKSAVKKTKKKNDKKTVKTENMISEVKKKKTLRKTSKSEVAYTYTETNKKRKFTLDIIELLNYKIKNKYFCCIIFLFIVFILILATFISSEDYSCIREVSVWREEMTTISDVRSVGNHRCRCKN